MKTTEKTYALSFCLESFIETKFIYDYDANKQGWYATDLLRKRICQLLTVMVGMRWMLKSVKFY